MFAAGSPSPSKRGSDNDVAGQRRDMERQQILQRLIASQIPSNRNNNAAETVMMTQLGPQTLTIQDGDGEVMETAMAAQLQLQLDLKAEKKVSPAKKKIPFFTICCNFYRTILGIFKYIWEQLLLNNYFNSRKAN